MVHRQLHSSKYWIAIAAALWLVVSATVATVAVFASQAPEATSERYDDAPFEKVIDPIPILPMGAPIRESGR